MAGVELILADGFKALQAYPGQSFDLLLWDGAYGIGEGRKAARRSVVPHAIKQSNGSYKEIKPSCYHGGDWDSAVPDAAFFKEGLRVSKEQIYFGANYFTDKIGLAEAPFKAPRREGFPAFLAAHPTGWIVWDKCSRNCFSDCELIYTSFQSPSFIFRYVWSGHMQGKNLFEGHVQRGNKKLNEKRIHPTQKPLDLYRMLLRRFAKPGYLVLDPFVGSGSSLLVAEEMKLRATGYEIEQVYYQGALARLEAYRKRRRETRHYQLNEQLRLF